MTNPTRDAPAPSDFQRLLDLVGLVVDAKNCKARLQELADATEAATKALAALAAERTKFEAEMVQERTKLSQERAELNRRALKVHQDEAASRRERESLIAAARERREHLYEAFPGGATRLKEHAADV